MESYHIYAVSSKNDRETALRLCESIKKYRLPKGTGISSGADELKSIFIDSEETPFDVRVKEQIKNSEYMIFICSPSSKNRSILEDRLLFFIDEKGKDRLMTVIADGEPEEAFPEVLREKKTVVHEFPDGRKTERTEVIEPVCADLRGDSEKKKKQLLRYETVRIAALVLGLHPDDLERRQEARRKKTLIRILSAAAAVVLVVSGIFTWLGIRANNEGKTAELQTELTVETAERTINELPELFHDDPEALSYIDDAIENARKDLEALGLDSLLDGTEEEGLE